MKAGTVLKLAMPGYSERHPQHLRKGMTEVLTGVASTADVFNADLATTVADANLSNRGRETGKKGVAAAALEKLAHVERTTIKGLDDHAAQLQRELLGRAAFTPPKDTAERIAYEMQMREVRDQLRQLPAAGRLTVYMATSDPLVLAAIETAPMTLSEKRPDGSRRLEPFIDPAERTAAVLARAARTDAATAERLREIGSLREVYSLAVNSVRKEILDEVPSARPESQPTIHVSA
jgi:hypothetical protein